MKSPYAYIITETLEALLISIMLDAPATKMHTFRLHCLLCLCNLHLFSMWSTSASFNVSFIPSLKFHSSGTMYLPLGLYSFISFKAVGKIHHHTHFAFKFFNFSSSSSITSCKAISNSKHLKDSMKNIG